MRLALENAVQAAMRTSERGLLIQDPESGTWSTASTSAAGGAACSQISCRCTSVSKPALGACLHVSPAVRPGLGCLVGSCLAAAMQEAPASTVPVQPLAGLQAAHELCTTPCSTPCKKHSANCQQSSESALQAGIWPRTQRLFRHPHSRSAQAADDARSRGAPCCQCCQNSLC